MKTIFYLRVSTAEQNPELQLRDINSICDKEHEVYKETESAWAENVTVAKKRQVQFQELFMGAELEMLLKRENRYEHLKLRNKIIISFLIYQAMTSEDVMRIDLNDVDLDKGTVYIKSSAKLASRTLPLTQLQQEYIEDYLHKDRKRLLKVQTERLNH